METFLKIWQNDVKKSAKACIIDRKMVDLYKKSKSNQQLTEDEQAYLKNLDYQDPYGMCHISDMISNVDKALEKAHPVIATFEISKVYQVLASPNYYNTVFNGKNNNSKECQSRKKLKKALDRLIFA